MFLLAALVLGISAGAPIGYVVHRKLRRRRMRRTVGDLMGWMKENAEIARNMTFPDCACPRCAAARTTKTLSN
jgi:transposase-like protein